MLTGRKTLASLDNAIGDVRQELAGLDQEIQRSNEDLLQRRREHSEQIKRLANLRADLLADDKVLAGLDQADRQAQRLLDTRREELAKLVAAMKENEQHQIELESQRLALTDQFAELADKIDSAEAKTQERLATDQTYSKQLTLAQKADAVALEAESKTDIAENDRQTKGEPYENDPLFMYLWRRQYGSNQYDANPLVRFLDGKVASVCKYHNARPNYKMLTEIPLRLREHSNALRSTANSAFVQLQRMEEQALTEDGVDKLRDDENQLRKKIEQIDEDIKVAEGDFRTLTDERAQYAAGQDKQFREAVVVLTEEFKREDVRALRRQAELTRPPDDDQVVQRLMELEHDIGSLDESLDENREIYARHKARLQELEEVRREFKRNRYDDVHSVFSNQSMMAGILGQFLRGMVTSDSLWRTIRRNQRFERRRSDPRFGTGGFGLPGGVWRSTRRRQSFPGFGGIGQGRRRSTARSGGGFRTGGGI